MIRYLCILLIFGFSLSTYANSTITTNKQLDDFPWAVMGYWGRMTNDDLSRVMTFQYTTNAETLYSLEFSHQLAVDNPLRLFFQPIFTTIEAVANFTYRDDPVGPIYEFNPYLAFRWANFPWNKKLLTSVAVGEGISYDSQVPEIELTGVSGTGNRLLNYLMFELTVALPSHPELEWVGRIHHRSGVFGLYGAENSGSTAIGMGLRYRF